RNRTAWVPSCIGTHCSARVAGSRVIPVGPVSRVTVTGSPSGSAARIRCRYGWARPTRVRATGARVGVRVGAAATQTTEACRADAPEGSRTVSATGTSPRMAGVHVSTPVAGSIVIPAGLVTSANVRGSPSASWARTRYSNGDPTVPGAPGVLVIIGAVFGG